MITVVACDDHGIVCAGIGRLVAETTDLVLQASALDGEELLEAVRIFRPAVAVVDIDLRGSSGLDLITPVTELSPETRVVMFSMYSARGYIEKSRSRGARGYVLKEGLDSELIDTIRRVAHGEEFVAPAPAPSAARPQKSAASLSSREFEVLKLLALGLTNNEIADELFVSPRTVESHRGSLQRKLGLYTRAELAKAVRDGSIET